MLGFTLERSVQHFYHFGSNAKGTKMNYLDLLAVNLAQVEHEQRCATDEQQMWFKDKAILFTVKSRSICSALIWL